MKSFITALALVFLASCAHTGQGPNQEHGYKTPNTGYDNWARFHTQADRR